MDEEVKKRQLAAGFVSHFAEMSGNRHVIKAMTILRFVQGKYQRTRQRTVRIFHWCSCDAEEDVKDSMRRPRPTLQMKEILKMYKQTTNAL